MFLLVKILFFYIMVFSRDVKSCKIRHPDIRIRYPDTSECSHRICQTIFASYMTEHIVASMLKLH